MPLVVDSQGRSVQAVFWGASDDLAVVSTSSRKGPYSGARLVRLSASVAMRIRVGGSTVVATATDTLLAAGDKEYIGLQDGQYIAAIGAGADDGVLNITDCD